MTDYEVLSLFSEFGGNTQETFVNYVGILSAFIVAAYLVADKLTTKMTIVIVALFTVVALQQGIALLLHWGDQVGLLAEIRTRNDLVWHGAHRAPPSTGLVFYATYFITVFGGYIGALAFFFDRRRKPRQ
jgi:4-amino-4-deoxy-L-arabinose transferase-like glycosyltransferase